MRFYARSASDKTDDWPYWLVADETRGGLNVTGELAERFYPETWKDGAVFKSPWSAVKLAMRANREMTNPQSK